MRRRKITAPTSLKLAQSVPSSQAVIIEPTLGFDASQPAEDLKPGQTPEASNFIVEDGYLTPRSGLSLFASSDSLADTGLYIGEHHSVDGNRYPVVASGGTLIFFSGAAWSTVSYLGNAANPLSGTSGDLMFGASVYDPVPDENYLVISNLKDVPKLWQPGATTYSDHSDFLSVESYGKIPYSIDDRLCFFNCASSQTTYATRVRWSERGLPSNMSTYGAGFQDLMDMKGVGSGVAVREFDALLFSTEQVWIQQPRRDNFAFNFIAIARSLGCPYPKTIAVTPQGVIFLTREMEPYLVTGNQIQGIGKPIHQYLRNQIRNVENSFGLYNSKRQRYEFYYDSGSASGRCNRGMWLDMDSGAWMPVDMHSQTLSAGAEAGADLGSDIIWDNVDLTWNEMETTWNQMVQSTSKDRDVMVVNSEGTVYRFRDEEATDAGSTITAQWDSHGMVAGDPTRKTSFTELWSNIKADSAGSYDLYQRGSPDENYVSVTSYAYDASDSKKIHNTPFVTGDYPQFRIRVSDGKRPKFSRFVAKLKDAGQY